MPTFWLSYTDPARPVGDRHLHVIVPADDIDAAVEIARGLGAVGEMSGSDLDDCNAVPVSYLGRVLADVDVDAMEATMAAERVRCSPTNPEPPTYGT
jgi:hypothetical protein